MKISETGIKNEPQFLKIEIKSNGTFWQDALFNGKKDAEDGGLFAHRFMKNGIFSLTINLDNGEVLGWPKDLTAELCYKVRDGGNYFLLDGNQCTLGTWMGGYVPEGFCCFGEELESWWRGDYIVFDVKNDGRIPFWKKPVIKWRDDVLKNAPKFDLKKIEKAGEFWMPLKVQAVQSVQKIDANKFDDQLFDFVSHNKISIRGKNGIYNYKLITNQKTGCYEIHAKRGAGCHEEDKKSEIPPPCFVFNDALVLKKEHFAEVVDRLIEKENQFQDLDILSEKLAQIIKVLVSDDFISRVLSKQPHLRGFAETHEMRTIFSKMNFD